MSIKSWISGVASSVGNFFGGIGGHVGGFLLELFSRIIDVPEFLVGWWFGWQHLKRIKVRVVILKDRNGVELVSHADVQPTLARTQQILQDEANVSVNVLGIVIVDEASPESALNVDSEFDLWLDNFGGARGYYRQYTDDYGVAKPLTVFIINNIEGSAGLSLGPFANYVLVEVLRFTSASPSRTVAHEIGHACGLLHRSDNENLLYRHGGEGDKLTNWQSSVMRSSHFIGYF